MILSTVPGMLVLGRFGIRPVCSLRCVILADLAMRGRAISFLTLARVASTTSFLLFLLFFPSMPSILHPHEGLCCPVPHTCGVSRRTSFDHPNRPLLKRLL